MVFGTLSDVYVQAEETWFKFVDAVSAKGIPLYAYTDFLEKKGIPSLPFTIALIILVIALMFLAFSASGVSFALEFQFRDDEGKTVRDVMVTVTHNGRELESERINSGYNLKLKNMPLDSVILIEAVKDGYATPESQEIKIIGTGETVSFEFGKIRKLITGTLTLYDAATDTIIMNAECKAIRDNGVTEFGRNTDGNIFFLNIPEGETVEIVCTANGYEDIDEPAYFTEGLVTYTSMSPKINLADEELVQVLIRAIDKGSKELIPGARIVIINAGNEEILFDDSAETGEYLAEIREGTIAKATIEAEGYITLATLPFHVVQGIEPIEIELEKGGTTATITIVSENGSPLQGAKVMLWDVDGRLIDSKMSVPGPFGGISDFQGLNPNNTYYVTAYKNGFLPGRLEFNPGIESDLRLELANSNPGNAGTLSLSVFDSTGLPAKKARVRFYEYVDDKRLPVGIPPQETDMQGRMDVQLPAGVFELEVETDLEKQYLEVEIIAGETTEETLGLERKMDIAEIFFFDNEGNPVQGNVKIYSKSGELLFEGRPDETGAIVFDSMGETSFDAFVETDDGKLFEEEIRIGEEEEATVTIFSVEEKMVPQAEFLGVFDAMGKEVEGISRGSYYWLKFSVNWSNLEQAGVHVRLGEDSKAFADSMEYGIYGFDSTASRSFYGKSYQAPLGTREDKQNKGRAGEKNKFLELYFDSEAEQQIVKVKVKANDDAQARTMPVYYRAWVKAGDKYFRDPEDSDIGTELSSREKGSLYAETKTASVKIYSSKPSCANGLCLEYSFFDEEGNEFSENNFTPVLGRRYALEIRASSDSLRDVQLSAETSQEELIRFAEFRSSSTRVFPSAGYDKAFASTNTISLNETGEKKSRVFFKAMNLGAAFVKVISQDADELNEKTIYFKITGPKDLLVEMEGDGRIKPGEDIHVKLSDAETGLAVDNAIISFKSGERPVFSVKGDGTENFGAGGSYLLATGNLAPGIYSMVVSSRDYKEEIREIIISVDNILGAEEEVEFFLEKNRLNSIESIELWNNINTAAIENISFEFFPDSKWSNNFALEVLLPGKIEGARRKNATLKLAFIGLPDERIHAEGELVVSGVLADGLYVKASTQIKANYNKPISTDCLEISPKENEVRILGEENKVETFDLTVNYLNSEGCTDPLVIWVNAEVKKNSDPNIEIFSGKISINPGQEKVLSVSVKNLIERVEDPNKKIEYSLVVESDKVSKSVALDVYFVNPYFSLESNDNIHVWASPDEDGKLIGIAPLYLRNVGKKAVTNITAAESGVFEKSGTFNVFVKPTQTGLFSTGERKASVDLASGEELAVPWTIEVNGNETDYTEAIYPIQLDLSGSIDGKRYSPMRLVTLWVHVSTVKCLKLIPVDDLIYTSNDSSQGVISKKVRVRNECGEIIRELTVTPDLFGENQLSLHDPGGTNTLYPGSEADFELKLVKRSDYFNEDRPDSVVVKGFLVNSQKFIESASLQAILKLGQSPEIEKGPTYDPVNIPVCEEEEAGTTKTVSFPKVSRESDCEESYCDAVQFAEFLAEKFIDKSREAKELMRTGNYDARNFNCSDSFCSFTSVGVAPEEFTVYLKNDFVSPEVVKMGVGSAAPSLSNYMVSVRSGNFSEILEGGTAFTPYNIYISQNLQGCGQYKFMVQGAVRNSSNALDEEQMVLYMKVTEDRKITPECTNKVQNIMNFLPVDTGLQGDSSHGAWPGMIQADAKLQEVGGDFAEALFGSKEGRVVLNTSSNKMRLLLKEIERGGILKLKVGQVSETTASPKTVTLELNALFDSEDETVRAEIAVKAKEAMRAMAQGSFALDACISSNESEMIIQKFEKLGQLKIEGETTIPLYYDSKTCAELTVNGTIKGEKIYLKTSYSSMSANEKAGLKNAWLETPEGTPISEYNDTSKASVLEMLEVEGKEGLYQLEILLCAEGDNGFVHQAIGKDIGVKAKSASIDEQLDSVGDVVQREMSDWYNVTVEVCGLHPYELLERISAINPENDETVEAFTVLAWKGDPDELSLESMTNAWQAFKNSEQDGWEDNEDVSFEERLQKIKKHGLWIYFGTCVVTSTICNGLLLKAWIIPLDWALDCGVPLIAGFFGPQIKESAIGRAWDSVKNFFHADEVESMADTVQALQDGSGDSGPVIEAVEEDLVTGAMLGISIREIFRALPDSLKNLEFKPGTSNTLIKKGLRDTSDSVATTITDNWAKSQLTGAAQYDNILKSTRKEMSDRVFTSLESWTKTGQGKLLKMSDAPLDAAAQGAWKETSQVMGSRIAMDPGLVRGSPLGNQVDNMVTRSSGNLFKAEKLGGNATDDFFGASKNELLIGTPPDPANVADNIAVYRNSDEVAEALHKRILDQLQFNDLKARHGGEALEGFDTKLLDQLKTDLRGTTTIDQKRLRDLTSNSFDEVRKLGDYDSVLSRVGGGQIDDGVQEAFQKGFSTSGAEVPSGGRLKNFFRQLKPGSGFYTKMFKGMVCGVASNLAGLSAQQAFTNLKLGEEKARVDSDGIDFTGPLSNYEGAESFRKFRPYKITVEKDTHGNIHLKIEEVVEEAQFAEMNAMLGEEGGLDKYYWKNDNCEAYMERGIDALIGCLSPRPENGVTGKMVSTYFANNATIANIALKNDAGQPLDESLLMAVLVNGPESVYGCSIGNEWFKEEEGERKSAIECAAGKLRSALVTENYELEQAVRALAENVLIEEELDTYTQNVLGAYETWQEFNFCDAS